VASDPRLLALAHTTSSAIAELAACLIVTPAETIKQQMQVATAAKKRVVSTAPLTMKSIWRGYWALAGRNIPFTAMQFPLYEHFRAMLAKKVGLQERKGGMVSQAGHQGIPADRKDVMTGDEARKRAYQTIQRSSSSSPSKQGATPYKHYVEAGLVSGASAALAGAISALITTPLDLLKTRVMLQSPSEKESFPTIRAIAADIWKREGFAGLMRGGTLRCAWTALGAGVYLGAYESGREWWNDAGKDQARDVVDRAGELIEEVKTS
jgi:solute carrier family 25 S-adenosylmethionine transporter 26